jgi:hypothetical protein
MTASLKTNQSTKAQRLWEAGCRIRALGGYLAKVRWNHAKDGCVPRNVDSVGRHLAPKIRGLCDAGVYRQHGLR